MIVQPFWFVQVLFILFLFFGGWGGKGKGCDCSGAELKARFRVTFSSYFYPNCMVWFLFLSGTVSYLNEMIQL